MSESPTTTHSKPLPVWVVIGAFALLAGFIALLALGYQSVQKKPITIGMPMPEFNLITFDQQVINSSETIGKVIVINFWASWCQPCEDEAELMEQTWQHYREEGKVLFLGIDYVDTEPQAIQFLKKFNITYPNGPDLRSDISKVFRIRGVPETYVFGPDGTLAKSIIGPVPSSEDLKRIIDSLVHQE